MLNLISSLYCKDQSGLLVSKTNPAVDIITNHYQKAFQEPIILRTGNKENRDRALEVLKSCKDGVLAKTITDKELADSENRYWERYKSVFAYDLDLRKRFELADEMASLTEEYQRMDSRIHGSKYQAWLSQTKLDLQDVLRILDQMSTYLNTINDLILESKAQLVGKVFLYIKNWIQGKRQVDVARLIKSDLVRIEFGSIPTDEMSLEELQKMVLKAKETLSILAIQRKLENIQREIGKLPKESDIIEKLEQNEQQMIKLGKELLSSRRRRILSAISFSAKRELQDYIETQELLLSSKGASIAALKKKESTLFPIIRSLFPVWGTTSLSARNSMFPLGPGIFDLLIIDEASQCDVASTIPLLFRAKRVCIIGDSNQFSHIVTFNQQTDQAIARRAKLSDEDHFAYSYKERSIYEVAERSLKSENEYIRLDEHYRSHPDIIAFSNREFYGRFLKIFTDPRKFVLNESERAVEWEEVEGEVTNPPEGSAFNAAEVEKVFEIAIAMMVRYHRSGGRFVSIGIVTPLRAQVQYLQNHFLKQSKKLDASTKLIYDSFVNHNVPFIIDTAYKFQGNERDVMIFSPVASTGLKPGTYAFINERRQLNVAITRARAKLIIVGNKKYCKQNEGYLGKLAEYADSLSISQAVNASAENMLESPIEKKLYDALREAGFAPQPQYAELGFRLDFAIIQSGRKLAIECNGLSTHRTMDGSSKRDDVVRRRRLEHAGWQVLVFWSWDILQNVDQCIEVVKEVFVK